MQSKSTVAGTASSILRPADIGPFLIIAAFYEAAVLLEMVEHWHYAVATLVLIGFSLVSLLHATRATFLVFLVVSTGYFLIFRFPDVANHVNLILFVSAGLIGVTLWSMIRRPGDDLDAFYESIAPLLRLSIIAAFAAAGFHKLNRDFVDPNASCIASFQSTIRAVFGLDPLGLGIPTVLWVAVIVVFAIGVFIKERRRDFQVPPIEPKVVLVPAIAILIMAALVLLLSGGSMPTGLRASVLFGLSVFVLCWQLVEGPLLLIRRFQWVALLLSLLVHVQLAMIRIVDFQAIALALLAAFVPTAMWRVWSERAMVTLLGVSIHRAQLYLLLNIAVGGALMLAFGRNGLDLPNAYVATGLLFNVSVLIVIWPFLSDLFSKRRTWRWQGTPVISGAMPRAVLAVPIALFLFGMTSHLGLRSAGNFSMFSNLRTEGELSNHLLMRGNPAKVFGFQDDLVTVVEIDDDAARIGYQYKSLQGNAIPLVEFRKLLYLWQRERRVVPIVIRYGGEEMRYDDINTAPDWSVAERDWAMRLLDFRIVQPDLPNACRW